MISRDSEQVAYSLDSVDSGLSVVTIGNFDGVHRGHALLLHRTVDAALRHNARSVAITFDPHPAAVLRPSEAPQALCSVEERAQRIIDTGIDLALVLEFTREMSLLSPAEFVERVLVNRLQALRVVVGTNFRFGHRATGDVVTLVECGEVHGFEVEAVALRDQDGAALSSSAIRRWLAEGDLQWASQALGRSYGVTGTVVEGRGRGRSVGIPTANVDLPPDRALPANGVYAGFARVGDRHWRCVTNIGVRPTFETEASRTVEVHLLDVEGELDLYGQLLEVTFEYRLRSERRFDSVEELVAQIRSDIKAAVEVLRPVGS